MVSLCVICLLGSHFIPLRRFKLAHIGLSIVVSYSSDVRKWIHYNLLCRETSFVYLRYLQSLFKQNQWLCDYNTLVFKVVGPVVGGCTAIC